MKASDGRSSVEHLDDLLLAYVEGILPQPDRERVEDHLDSCVECRTQVAELETVIAALKGNKGTICPEPWQLHDFLIRHEDPEGRIAAHIRECPICRTELEELRKSCDTSEVPEAVTELFRRHSAEPAGDSLEQSKSSIARLADMISSLFRVPALALGTAAALVLLVVLLYPGTPTRPVVGLSGVTWPDLPEPRLKAKSLNLMGLSRPSVAAERPKPRVAVILLFSGFKHPLPQGTIDSLYRSLAPSRAILRHLELMPPSAVKDAVGSLEHGPSSDPASLTVSLKEKLGLSGLLHVTITVGDEGYRIEGEMTNANTGRLVRKNEKTVALQNELPEALRELAVGLLKQARL